MYSTWFVLSTSLEPPFYYKTDTVEERHWFRSQTDIGGKPIAPTVGNWHMFVDAKLYFLHRSVLTWRHCGSSRTANTSSRSWRSITWRATRTWGRSALDWAWPPTELYLEVPNSDLGLIGTWALPWEVYTNNKIDLLTNQPIAWKQQHCYQQNAWSLDDEILLPWQLASNIL